MLVELMYECHILGAELTGVFRLELREICHASAFKENGKFRQDSCRFINVILSLIAVVIYAMHVKGVALD